MIKILFPFICGLVWCWRGYSFPKAIHGYYRSALTSFVIIGAYCLCTPNLSVFSLQGLYAVLCLTALEGLLGYGSSCELIDNAYTYNNGDAVEVNYLLIEDEAKEPLNYLGFIGMSYYLFPYMILHMDKPIWVYFVVAILGYRIFPLNKMAQLKTYNQIADSNVIKIPVVNKEIMIPKWVKLDAWKIVEFFIGMGFGLWLSGFIGG